MDVIGAVNEGQEMKGGSLACLAIMLAVASCPDATVIPAHQKGVWRKRIAPYS